ncbi:TPA: LuxR C-terminal-related transcriptional regulator [Serratia odorifera]
MKSCHVITPCHFTRVAIRQLIGSQPVTILPTAELLIIDIRYDLSLIELVLRLKTLKTLFPHRRCIFIADPIRSKMPHHLGDDYIDSNSALEEILHKINTAIGSGRLRSCVEHYTTIIKNINITEAQMRVMREIMRGMSTNQIAKKHTLSVKTVYSHASNIKERLNISTRYTLFHYFTNNSSAISVIESNFLRNS